MGKWRDERVGEGHNAGWLKRSSGVIYGRKEKSMYFYNQAIYRYRRYLAEIMGEEPPMPTTLDMWSALHPFIQRMWEQ